jgi:hypothetical protein
MSNASLFLIMEELLYFVVNGVPTRAKFHNSTNPCTILDSVDVLPTTCTRISGLKLFQSYYKARCGQTNDVFEYYQRKSTAVQRLVLLFMFYNYFKLVFPHSHYFNGSCLPGEITRAVGYTNGVCLPIDSSQSIKIQYPSTYYWKGSSSCAGLSDVYANLHSTCAVLDRSDDPFVGYPSVWTNLNPNPTMAPSIQPFFERTVAESGSGRLLCETNLVWLYLCMCLIVFIML